MSELRNRWPGARSPLTLAEEQAFLKAQYERGRAAAAARDVVHDREWQAGISHSDEFGGED